MQLYSEGLASFGCMSIYKKATPTIAEPVHTLGTSLFETEPMQRRYHVYRIAARRTIYDNTCMQKPLTY